MMAFLIAFVVFVALLYLAGRRSHRTSSPLRVKGKIIYADQGRKSKLFINRKYGITAKPDFIITTPNGENMMVEYKSRTGRVYQSDIVQLLASVLAARSEMPIHRAVVVTKGTRREIELGSDEHIFRKSQNLFCWLDELKKVRSSRFFFSSRSMSNLFGCK